MALLIVAALLMASAFAPPQTLTRDRYLSLVESYRERSLEPRTALQELTRKRELERVLDALRAVPPERLRIKAAVLMHTEIAFLHAGPGDESARDLQIELAEKLLPLVRDEDFEARFRIAAGYLYQSSLSPNMAIDHFEKARRLLPEESALGIARVHEALGAFELEQIPTWSVPELERRHRERKRIEQHRKEGRLRLFEAIEAYSKSIGLNARSPTAYLRRGRCYQLLLEEDEARSDYRRVLDLAPTERERGLVHLFLGESYGASGDFEASQLHYRAALAALPEWQEPGLGLSYVLQELGRAGESRTALDRVIEGRSSSRAQLVGMQSYYLGTGAFLELVESLRREITH